MRRAAVLLFAFVLASPGLADDLDLGIPAVTYPALPERAAAAADFVPQGWVLEQTVSGDLDGDGAADLVLLLRDKDPANVVTTLTSDAAPYDTNPRLLAVAFADPEGGYRLALQNHTLIPRPDNPGQEDVMLDGGLAVDRGSLVVELSLFMNAGGADAGRSVFRFRPENDDFRLIGYDNHNVNRISGAVKEVSVNYLTGKVIIKTGSIENDVTKSTGSKLRKKPVLSIGDVGNGMMFEPEY